MNVTRLDGNEPRVISSSLAPTRRRRCLHAPLSLAAHSPLAHEHINAGRRRYANRIADEVTPQKSVAEHQGAEPGRPNAVDPRGMIELARLDDEREGERAEGEPDRSGALPDSSRS